MNLAETARKRLENAKKRQEALKKPLRTSNDANLGDEWPVEETISEKIAQQRRLQDELLGEFESVAAVEAMNGEMQGRIRALEFTIEVFSELKADLQNKLVGLSLEDLADRFNQASVEAEELTEAVASAEEELKKVRARCGVRYLSESELETLRKENTTLGDQVTVLQEQIVQVAVSRVPEDEISGERALLIEKTHELISKLRALEEKMTRVCEARLDLLAFSIEQQEILLKVSAKKREFVELSEFSPMTLEAIPEEYPAVNIDFESDDIDVRQEELRALHQSVREANEMREALRVRIFELETDLK